MQAIIGLLAVDAKAFAWPKATSATSSLSRRALRNGSDLERIDAGGVLECSLLDKAAVDHVLDSGNGHRCLCNVCAQNDFAFVPRLRLEHFVLLVWWQVRVET